MAQLGQTYANMVINSLLRNGTFTNPTHPLYFGLAVGSSGLRTDSWTNEVSTSGTGYTRVAVGVGQTVTFSAASAGLSSNEADLVMPTATGAWGTVNTGFLATTATPGTGICVLWGSLSPSRAPEASDILKLLTGELDISL